MGTWLFIGIAAWLIVLIGAWWLIGQSLRTPSRSKHSSSAND